MTTLTAPSASFVVSTSDNLIKYDYIITQRSIYYKSKTTYLFIFFKRFVDLRSKNYAHELRTCYAPSGIQFFLIFLNILIHLVKNRLKRFNKKYFCIR